jgi:hypothetical protein
MRLEMTLLTDDADAEMLRALCERRVPDDALLREVITKCVRALVARIEHLEHEVNRKGDLA